MPIWNPDEEVLKQTAKAVREGKDADPFDLCQLYMVGYGDIKADPAKAYRYFLEASQEYNLYGYDKKYSLWEDCEQYLVNPHQMMTVSGEDDDLVITFGEIPYGPADDDPYWKLEPIHIPQDALADREGVIFLLLPVQGQYYPNDYRSWPREPFTALFGIALQKTAARWELFSFWPSTQEILEAIYEPAVEKIQAAYGCRIAPDLLNYLKGKAIEIANYGRDPLREDFLEHLKEIAQPAMEADARWAAECSSGDWLTTELNPLHPGEERLKEILQMIERDEKPDDFSLCQLLTFGCEGFDHDPELACRLFQKVSGGTFCMKAERAPGQAAGKLPVRWHCHNPKPATYQRNGVRCEFTEEHHCIQGADTYLWESFYIFRETIEKNLVRCDDRDLAFFLVKKTFRMRGEEPKEIILGLLIEKGTNPYHPYSAAVLQP